MQPIKHFAIRMGLYRPARLLHRAIYRAERLSFRSGLKFYSEFIKSGDLVFDVGANIGAKTEIYLKLGARVVAIEPQRELAAEIRARSSAYRGMCEVVEVGISDRIGTAQFQLREPNVNATLTPDWPGIHVGAMTIATTTLNQLIGSYGKPSFIKMDIEGHEFCALQGLSEPIDYLTIEYFCDDRGIERIRNCISYLSSLCPVTINATGKEDHRLLFSRWMNSEHFIKSFPHCVQPNFYGDLIIHAQAV